MVVISSTARLSLNEAEWESCVPSLAKNSKDFPRSLEMTEARLKSGFRF